AGVYRVGWRVDTGAAGPRRALSDSLVAPSRPMLASLGRATLVGVIGAAAGPAKRNVLAVRRLESDGTLSRWLYLGSGVKSADLAARGEHGPCVAWADPAPTAPPLP